MDKDVLVHIYNGILLSHKKNAFVSGLIRWMNLEPIIQSEVSQKEKYKYRTLTNTYGIEKESTDEFICKAAMEKQRQRRDIGRGKERVNV